MQLIQVTDQRLGDDIRLRRYVETIKECAFCHSTIDYVLVAKSTYTLALCRECAHVVPATLFAKLGTADPTMIVLGGERALDALRTGMMANFNMALANELAGLLSKGSPSQQCDCPECQAAAAQKNGQPDLNSMLKHMGMVMSNPKGKKPKPPKPPESHDPPFGSPTSA